ncbi:MAG TPA: helix-turn-helix transcriptional regulator [Enterovirga sp.]|nr:helix-turn-helix transcriptional regulator [Enterovirga sp.]
MKKAPNQIDRHVGGRVRMRRMMIKMSQEKLGEALGLTFQQVQKYEKGTNRIGASRLQQIAGVLGVPVDYFFSGAPQGDAPTEGFAEQAAPGYEADLLTADGLKLLRAFHGIKDQKVRRRIVELAQTLAGADAAAEQGAE